MSSVIERLRAILPEEAVISGPESLQVYECDALSAYRTLPRCVVLPADIDQVLAVIRICHAENIPVVARGAGTGLSGGALPVADGVVMSLAKLNRILAIDPDRRLARVQPGVRNLSVSEAAAPYGLFYAPDPSSQIACTIGGNVAENSGGVHCLKYGLTVHNITALKIITIEGELLVIGSEALDTPGFDLLALLTGSEGMLGVVVEVTLKLLPKPVQQQILLAAFDSVDAAGNGVAAIIAAGIIPAGLEMMDNAGIRAVESYIHAGYPVDAAAILLCELDGVQEEVDSSSKEVADILIKSGASEVRMAKDKAEGEKFWAGRKAAFPAVGRIAADYYCMDGTIPRKHIARVLQTINDLSRQYGLGVVNVFHAGDGNLHPLILYDVAVPGELERAEEFGGKILETCVAVGGTITGEHGVGIEKINQMCVQFNAQELILFHDIKHAFDPPGLLNPGKAVPTLKRCAEFGAMHVHAGQLPFPELERF
ncbi:MAG: glycolate oxidase subunit GlcD [Gammaproteobacteria bacterium RIFCSPLOWO2_02_FULL_47_50]|nr:MAG: glycolate oxidase subunit GlcD [Gammaproteobacteria bacterium RIFCSPLOWO2_02_47_7]OGT66431.1 MAG: glycolate oxidase subunit GlcD [Gammaproteobacteria bacterium RIFCSPLOWO2_01_FULL_47_190]OGT76232.1 MAG: glycolate oxidase subunit GlcD [Gammaproteobacteria bacterium RIFCSPLOWO2_12_47_11]OGT79980.1 MAG: glycolate oxidase subunit GlcD [Gammaproteobacteria bacterium RIFCSPLOWO2_02_FULL_47_50]OGT83174.1 MAG: glycolate oxidase subunit GlcD [Gammaproteobacteria bacterium RIFCSPLOWO2_12_FULL_47_